MTDRLLPPERVEVVQYAADGSNAAETCRFVNRPGRSWPNERAEVTGADHSLIRWRQTRGGDVQYAYPGQTLIRHPDNTITVHDSDLSVEAE